MDINKKINILIELEAKLTNLNDSQLKLAIQNAYNNNNWFTVNNITKALTNISKWLKKEILNNWVKEYNLNDNLRNKKVGIIMAGNIPLVNFHDLICCFLSGNIAICKLSGKDTVLMEFILAQLYIIEPKTKELIYTAQQLKDIDAIIATGSDNSFRYFDYYFGKKPHIFRKNRNSIAVLNGNETKEDYNLLGNDIFDYYGLGCRNISKVFFPKEYSITTFLDNIASFKHVIDNNKYKNNFDYNLSIYLLNKEQHWHNEFVIMKESTETASPCAVLYFEYYGSKDELTKKLNKEKEKIQCIVSNEKWLEDFIPLGSSQMPELSEYPDNVDTMEFLTTL